MNQPQPNPAIPGPAEVEHLRRRVRALEAGARALLDAIPSAAAEVDAGGRVVACNRRFAALCGAGEADLIGAPLAGLRPAGDGRLCRRPLPPPAEGELVVAEPGWADEERFRALCEAAPIGVFLTDARGRAVYHNPRWLALAGLTLEESLGYGWTRALHPDDRAALLDDWRRTAASGDGPWLRRHRLLTAPGEVRWVNAWAAPLRGRGGELLGYVGTVEDVTEQVRAEEAQRLESLGVLAGGVAHDFNNLLTGIIGYASLARQQVAPSPPTPLPRGERGEGAARDYLDRVLESARRAAELCGQMLAYSGRGRFVVGPLDLSRAVRDLGALLRASVSGQATLTLELADGLPPVSADAAQVRQAVLNLVLNASEALGGRSGAVVVRTGRAWRDRGCLSRTYLNDDLSEGEYVFIEVADTGAGMDAETRRRVFEPFFTTKFTGRGLGLAAVLGIVRGHRGAVELASEPGRGTTVRVWFPRAPDAEAAPPAPEPAAAPGAGGAVLFVDDEPALRDLAVRALRPAGYEALTAGDGREALEVLRARADVRVVVLDLTMPGPDADETLRELRQLRPGVAVVLSSGYGGQEAGRQFEADGRTEFLQKPYRPRELIEKVRQALQ